MYIVFTGRCPGGTGRISRTDLFRLCRHIGHTPQSAIDSRTQLLVASRYDTAKARSARDRGIGIMTYNVFLFTLNRDVRERVEELDSTVIHIAANKLNALVTSLVADARRRAGGGRVAGDRSGRRRLSDDFATSERRILAHAETNPDVTMPREQAEAIAQRMLDAVRRQADQQRRVDEERGPGPVKPGAAKRRRAIEL